MDIPANLDESFDRFQKLRRRLDETLSEAEEEQRAGRSGYEAVVRAEQLSQELNQMAPELLAMIEDARTSL